MDDLERKYWEVQLEYGESPEFRMLASLALNADTSIEREPNGEHAKKAIELLREIQKEILGIN